jgi:DNA polymerase III delta prime subunit
MSFASFLLQCHSQTPQLEQVLTWAKDRPELQSLSFLTPSADSAVENSPDFHRVNSPEENLSIELVRDMIGQLSMKPYQEERSVFVIFNIDQASVPAQNALLKSLEEPPLHAVIILTTSEPYGVLPTIRSRCVEINLVRETTQTQTNDDVAELKEVWGRIASANSHELFEISEKYKERDQALGFIQGLTRFLHAENEAQPSMRTTQVLQNLMTTRGLLEKNVNVRLALEDFLFGVKKMPA